MLHKQRRSENMSEKVKRSEFVREAKLKKITENVVENEEGMTTRWIATFEDAPGEWVRISSGIRFALVVGEKYNIYIKSPQTRLA